MIYVALVLACILCLSICLNTMSSGYRKGPDEDDGFWEVYNMQWRLHILITLSLLVITIMWVPTTIAYARLMTATMADVKFFRDDLPKLDGCIDDYNIKEAIDQAKDLTGDQLVMNYVSVSLQGMTILFAIINILAVMVRRCVENAEAMEEEYETQMGRINKGGSESEDSDSFTTKRSSNNSNRRMKLNFHKQKPIVEESSEVESQFESHDFVPRNELAERVQDKANA